MIGGNAIHSLDPSAIIISHDLKSKSISQGKKSRHKSSTSAPAATAAFHRLSHNVNNLPTISKSIICLR